MKDYKKILFNLFTVFLFFIIPVLPVAGCGETSPPEWYEYKLQVESVSSKDLYLKAENLDDRNLVRIVNSGSIPLYLGHYTEVGSRYDRSYYEKINWQYELPENFIPDYKLVENERYTLPFYSLATWNQYDDDDFEVEDIMKFCIEEPKNYQRKGSKRISDLPDDEYCTIEGFYGDEPVEIELRVDYDLNRDYDKELKEYYDNPNNCNYFNDVSTWDSNCISNDSFCLYELLILFVGVAVLVVLGIGVRYLVRRIKTQKA